MQKSRNILKEILNEEEDATKKIKFRKNCFQTKGIDFLCKMHNSSYTYIHTYMHEHKRMCSHTHKHTQRPLFTHTYTVMQSHLAQSLFCYCKNEIFSVWVRVNTSRKSDPSAPPPPYYSLSEPMQFLTYKVLAQE